MPQTLADRVTYVSYKLGNRSDLTDPIGGTVAGGVTAVVVVAGGDNYQEGDIIDLLQAGAYGAQIKVVTVDIEGVIQDVEIIKDGFYYTTGAVLNTGGNGLGASFSITANTEPSPSRIDIWLRDAYINLLMENRFPLTEDTIDFNLVQGVSKYDYPSTVRAIETLTLYRPDGTVITVETKDMAYLRRMNSQNQAAPSMWADFGASIHFKPVPDDNGPYNCVLDVWMNPVILDPISTTPILLPEDWLEALDYAATVRGHTELQEEDKAHADQSLLYGYIDPQSGKYTPGMIQNLQNRIQASAPFKDWGMQPKGKTQNYTRSR